MVIKDTLNIVTKTLTPGTGEIDGKNLTAISILICTYLKIV